MSTFIYCIMLLKYYLIIIYRILYVAPEFMISKIILQ